MRPLLGPEVEAFEARFDYAINGTLRSLSVSNPQTIVLRLSVQDEARGFDWIDLEIEVSGVTDARLVEDDKLGFLDMSDGITVMFESGEAIVAVGEFDYLESALDAPLFIRGSALKYQEKPFSA